MKRRLTLLAVLILSAALVSSCVTLGGTGSGDTMAVLQSATRIGQAAVEASKEITEEQEIYLGRSVSAKVLARYKLLRNPRLHKYINLVGTSVAMVSDRPDLTFHFAVLDTKEVNAFAAPGGFIFITLGTIKAMKDEEELAGVLGHEVGHACAKHSLKSIKKGMWKKVAVITAQEGARHKGVNPELLDLFGQVTDKVLDSLLTVGYEQPMEFEADRLGQAYATRAGYDPSGLRRFATMMRQKEKRKDKSLTARLGTHPSFKTRLENLPAPKEKTPAQSIIKIRRARFRTATR